MNDRLEKILFIMFDDLIKGVDQYNHQGSLWLILTDEKKWILEFTKTKTLWYNHTIFKDRMSFAAMDCVENKEYITKWFESRFLNKPKAQDTLKRPRKLVQQVEDAIENGVKKTDFNMYRDNNAIEDTIQNGVKDTAHLYEKRNYSLEDTIQNGVKHTKYNPCKLGLIVEDTIQNGVKHTSSGPYLSSEDVEYTIQNGVKETTPSGYLGSIEMKGEIVHQFESPKQNNEVEDTIQNGVKETLNTAYMPQEMVEETIENGIKETKTPGKDGNIQSTLEWVSKNGTFSVRELIDGVIENGVKETKIGAPDNRDYFIKDTIENGVKLTNSSLQIDGSCVIEDVIKEGVKYTGGIGNPNWMGDKVETAIENGVKQTFKIQWSMEIVEEAIQKGIKNTYSDILPKEYDWSNQFDVQEVIDNGVKHTEYGDWEDGDERLDDIIQNGVKATLNDPHHRQREVVQTMKEGIKETIGEDYPHTNRIDGVIKNGVKETLSSVYPIERVVEKVVEVGVLETKSMDEWVNTYHIVNEVMNNGIKEVQPLPAQDGNRDWGNYYYRKGEPTKPHTKYVDDVLEKGEKI